MRVICLLCGYRTDRDVVVGQEIPCPWCEHFFVAGGFAVDVAPPTGGLSLRLAPVRGPGLRGVALLVLLFAGLLIGLSVWTQTQFANNGAVDGPGRSLAARGYVIKVAFSSDGQRLAGGGGIYQGRGKWTTGEINVWDPARSRVLLAFAGHAQGVSGLDFSPDGKHLASAGADGVKVWDSATGKQVLTLRMQPREEAWRVMFDPHGQRLATLSWRKGAGGNDALAVRVWYVQADAQGEQSEPLFTHRLQGHGRVIWNLPGLAFHPDGRYLACGPNRTVLLWDLNRPRSTRPARVLEGHSGDIRDLTFSPDGKRLATSADDETVRIWDPDTGAQILAFDSPRDGFPGHRHIQCLAFSPDGKRLAGGKAQYVAIWDAASGARLHYLGSHRDETVESVAFSPDGKTLAAAAKGQVKLWDLVALKHHAEQALDHAKP